MKNWIAAIVAALVVVGIGTAVASVPSGSETTFSVNDPAVTVLGSGQSVVEAGVNPRCEFTPGLTYCGEQLPSFHAVRDGVCQVQFDIAVIGAPPVVYGVGVNASKVFDESGVSTTPNGNEEASVSRTRLVPVEAGKTYSFSPWIEGSASASAYWSGDYVCFG